MGSSACLRRRRGLLRLSVRAALVPGYVAFMTGGHFPAEGPRRAVLPILLFVAGFTVVFKFVFGFAASRWLRLSTWARLLVPLLRLVNRFTPASDRSPGFQRPHFKLARKTKEWPRACREPTAQLWSPLQAACAPYLPPRGPLQDRADQKNVLTKTFPSGVGGLEPPTGGSRVSLLDWTTSPWCHHGAGEEIVEVSRREGNRRRPTRAAHVWNLFSSPAESAAPGGGPLGPSYPVVHPHERGATHTELPGKGFVRLSVRLRDRNRTDGLRQVAAGCPYRAIRRRHVALGTTEASE